MQLEDVDLLVKAASDAASKWARTVAPALGLPEPDYQAWCQRPEVAAIAADHRMKAANAATAVALRAALAPRGVVGNDVT